MPIDFSDVTRDVVVEALRLASRLGGRIVLLHVLRPPGLSGMPEAQFTELAPMIESMRGAAGAALERWRAFVARTYRDVQTVQADGYPAREIARLTRTLRARYVVVGAHGHSGIYSLLVGTTTSGVLSQSRVPVVVVRSPRRKSRR